MSGTTRRVKVGVRCITCGVTWLQVYYRPRLAEWLANGEPIRFYCYRCTKVSVVSSGQRVELERLVSGN